MKPKILKPFKFYSLVDKESGKIIKSAFKEEDLDDLGGKYDLVEKDYEGCPAWSSVSAKSTKAAFDFSDF